MNCGICGKLIEDKWLEETQECFDCYSEREDYYDGRYDI